MNDLAVKSGIINDVGYAPFDKQAGLFGHQFQRKTLEDVLLRSLRDRADENAADVVLSSKPCYGLDVEEEVAIGDARDRDWKLRGRS